MLKTKDSQTSIKSPLTVSKYDGKRNNAVDNILGKEASATSTVPTHDLAEYNNRLSKLTSHMTSMSDKLSDIRKQQSQTSTKLQNCDTAVHANAQDNDANTNVISGSINNLTKADNMLNTNVKNLNDNIERYSTWVKYSGIGITVALVGVIIALIA